MWEALLGKITTLDSEAIERCQLRLDNLTKPLGSLHALEHLAAKMAGITGKARPSSLKKSIIIMSNSENTVKVGQIVRGEAVINALARHVEADTELVELDYSPILKTQQVITAINKGIEAANSKLAQGVSIIGLGSISANECACKTILADYEELAAGNVEQVINSLLKSGSLEIAGLVGVIIASAAGKAAIVLDGLATGVAALLATKLEPIVKEYLIGSHFAAETDYKAVLEILGIPAYLHLKMNFGDGAGAALGITLIDAGLHVLNDMKTFGEAKVAVADDGPGALRQRHDVKE